MRKLSNKMDPNLPNLNSPNQNQILIHPDHAAGTLKVSKAPSGNSPKPTNTLIILGIIAVVGFAALTFFFIPRTQAVMFANSTEEKVKALNDKTGEVDDDAGR